MVDKKDKKKPTKKPAKKPKVKTTMKQTSNQKQTVIVNLGKSHPKKRVVSGPSVPKSSSVVVHPASITVNPTVYERPRNDDNVRLEAIIKNFEATRIAPVEPVAPVAPVVNKKRKTEVPVAVAQEKFDDEVPFAGNAMNAPRRGRPPYTEAQKAIAKHIKDLGKKQKKIEKDIQKMERVNMGGEDVNVNPPIEQFIEPEPVPNIIIARRRKTHKIKIPDLETV